MAMNTAQYDPQHLHGLVDMGSNGIRFSVSSLQPPTARIMPTLYQDRVGISLYDAQYSEQGERIPLSDQIIGSVITSFKLFKQTCRDFQVPDANVRVLATEATRTAVNSEAFMKKIKAQVGWDVTLLPKEEEGRVGAMGIASSLPDVSGLVMDLGGGSTQLSWLIKTPGSDEVRMPDGGAVSMPYGAAAMSRRLNEAERNGSTNQLKREIHASMTEAFAKLEVPNQLEDEARAHGGYTLYLSGGGFRGWGYVLMSRHHVQPYPIPVINGFKASRKEFLATDDVKAAAAAVLDDPDEEAIFRVSDRRAGQVPAVAFLVNVLAEVLPQLKEVRFCQGGVREGFLLSTLSPETRNQHPLIVATQPFDTTDSSANIVALLRSACPSSASKSDRAAFDTVFTTSLLEAFANLLYYHSSHSKDLQVTSALRCTTSGILASVHGIFHESRVLLALLLCARWGGSPPPGDEQFKRSLELLVEAPITLWWINHLGAVAALIASVYPAGFVKAGDRRVRFGSGWGTDDKGRSVLDLKAVFANGVEVETYAKEVKDIEKVGKRKRWVGGRDGIGYKIVVLAESAQR